MIPNGVLLIDVKNKEITYANKEMAKILGCSGDIRGGAIFEGLQKFKLYFDERAQRDL